MNKNKLYSMIKINENKYNISKINQRKIMIVIMIHADENVNLGIIYRKLN